MRVLGIHLGHDSNICVVEDGRVINVYEPERYYKRKGYKLNAITLQSKRFISSYQWVNVGDLRESLDICLSKWGYDYDYIGVSCAQDKNQFKNLKIILKEFNVSYKVINSYNHHLCHTAGVYYTSNFKDALILSYDGKGNDGKTMLFLGKDEILKTL